MGCKPSKSVKLDSGDIYDKNVEKSRVLLSGIKLGRKDDGIEGGIQFSFRSLTSKNYKKCERNFREKSLNG